MQVPAPDAGLCSEELCIPFGIPGGKLFYFSLKEDRQLHINSSVRLPAPFFSFDFFGDANGQLPLETSIS